jgi:pimeloyl-ACP methyl ester carboxylesterase
MTGALVERVEIVRSNGLDHALHRFEVPGAASRDGRRTVLLLHGFLDSARTFEMLAAPLARAGLEVVAPDFRGFGQSGRVPAGGYYHFPDYVADVEGIVKFVAPERLFIVAHSMGGSVATLFCGARPERVEKLVTMEGLGPLAAPPETAPDRMRRWLADLDRIERQPRPLASLSDAVDRLAVTHPRVSREILATRAERLVVKQADGTLTWAWDPLHRSISPTPFSPEVYAAFLRQITCPTLFLHGGPNGWHPPDEEERLSHIAKLERVEISDAGHMMHWTKPAETAAALLAFFSS